MSRQLTSTEILTLESQGCRCNNWSKVSVSDKFRTEHIMRCQFLGEVTIGDISGENTGTKLPNGLYDSTIANCRIGNGVLVEKVAMLRNYTIGDNVSITNCGTIDASDIESQRPGKMLLINEGGGREVQNSLKLTAALAHIVCHYQSDRQLVSKLNGMLAEEPTSHGIIAQGNTIANCVKILNVNIGHDNILDGVQELNRGTIGHDNVIGAAVVANDFVIVSDSIVDGGATLERSHVGEGCRIGKQFSAVDSAFFANCQAFHGEACSLFAGPYTVTHHKSTLLIACQTSFFNAGSATNQSNHLYKLGPLHQGIMERGCKTASGSYLMWPGHIGAFTMVMGHHSKHLDTSELPFSYVIERDGKSMVMPAANLRSAGTWRDMVKWTERDVRSQEARYDIVNTAVFTPYIANKIAHAIELLTTLLDQTSGNEIHYKGFTVKTAMVSLGIKLYQQALQHTIGQLLQQGIAQQRIMPQVIGADKWVDWAGLTIPYSAAQELLEIIKISSAITIDDINTMLQHLLTNYNLYAYNWARDMIAKQGITTEQAIEQGNAATAALKEMVISDAMNDFADFTKIGYGLESEQEADFRAVRGDIKDSNFIKKLQE